MRVVIDGAGEVGSHLAKMLVHVAKEIIIIDSEQQRLDKIKDVRIETILGNPSSISVLKKARVGKADLFIAVYPNTNQEVNLVSAVMAKRLGAAKVIARVNDEELLQSENKMLFKDLGIELLFYPEKIAADEIFHTLKLGPSPEMKGFGQGALQISVFKISDEQAPILGKKFSEFISGIDPELNKKFRVLTIRRGSRHYVPTLDTVFSLKDLVFIASTKDSSEEVSQFFGKNDLRTAKNVMIVGGSAIALILARTLSNRGVHVKIIDNDLERCNYLKINLPDKVTIIHGDGRNPDIIYEEGIVTYDSFIALTNSDESNILACVMAKKFNIKRTIAEVENNEYIQLAEEMGVNAIINKKLVTASRIFKFVLSSKSRFVRYLAGYDIEFIEYLVSPGAEITTMPIKDLDLPQGCIICGVQRGEDAMIAVGDTRIEAYDRVAIYADPKCLNKLDKFFQ